MHDTLLKTGHIVCEQHSTITLRGTMQPLSIYSVVDVVGERRRYMELKLEQVLNYSGEAMKQILWLFGIIFLNQIVGCASMMQPTGNINEQIDYWLDQQEYGKALELVADLKEHPVPDITNLQEIQNKIRSQAERYEQQAMTDAEKSAANSDWHTALALYQEALSRLPDSTILQQGQQQLLQRQVQSLARLELDQLIAQGEWRTRICCLVKRPPQSLQMTGSRNIS